MNDIVQIINEWLQEHKGAYPFNQLIQLVPRHPSVVPIETIMSG